MSELFSIQLQNRQQQGRDGVWLDLPTTTEQVQAALRQIGISSDNPQGLFISGYFAEEEKRIAIPYNMVLASNVDELNFLASRLETLSAGERAELNAALQAPQSELSSIGKITDFPENVDYYVHLPEVHGAAQLGDYYLNRSGMVDMPEEWKGGIDTAQFGRYVAQQEQGAFTQYGYLVKSGDEWQKVHEGQPVPEEYRVLSFPAPEILRDAANIPPPVQTETEPQKVIPIILNGKDSAERMKEITDRLETGIQELFDSDRYKAYLTTMAKFHNYSFNNTLLIAMQGGQLVAGFNKWKDTFHRTVKKGEKGIKILAPAPYKVKQKMEKLDEHLAELRQQREADLSNAQEAAFALDNGNTLFIQTCDSGYDYTLYGPDHKALDGGQLDASGLTLPDAGEEALNLLGQTAAVSEVLLGDKLAVFQEAAEKANEIPAPVKIPDPAAEPTVTILWSESDKLQDGEIMPLSVANRVFEELDTTQHTDREKDGYTGGWYDKTAFRIDFTLNGQPDNYEGRQDFGDGDGSLIQHIQNYHEYYAKDENWKNFVLHNKGTEAWEQDKAEREMVLTEFIPYLKQHCNLSAMEQAATAALREGQNISPEQTAYYNAVVAYVQDCRPLLNQGQYSLPEPPKLADFDQTLQDYKAQVQAEIAQEAAAAGMTVEEYAAAGFEAPQQDSFSIYQLRNDDSTRDYRFEPFDRLQAAGLSVDKANYTEVYAAPLAAGTTLEGIYRTFNVDHPADFKGHSLSVSDVVVLHQNGHDTAHYCDSVGFQQVPEFLLENPLRTAELSTEQNENMIDGVLNNAPSLGELEAKAKAGEQISLTDLAAAVKAEEKAPKAKKSRAAKPKKPSIRAQLDAAKKKQSKQLPPREKAKELEV